MDGLEVKSVEVKGLVYEDKDNSRFTVMLVGEDGPVVSEKTLEDAKKSFECAMEAYFSMKNLMVYRRAYEAKERAELVKKMKEYLSEKEYSSVFAKA